MMTTKQHILTLLENSRGESISGEYIATQLHISRNSVWKAIKELRNDGYKIEAVTNKGYCLCLNNDILSKEGMIHFLLQKEIIDKIHLYDSLETTNKTAKEMAISEAEHGTVVIAESQSAGRGRFGRQFFSPSGGIYMSVILHNQQLSFETPTLITALAAVAVCKAIEAVTQKTPLIKWVNDVFLDDKKICGILTEAVTDFESGSMQWIVVGIGINFSTKESDFPDDLRQISGSIFPNGHQTITRNRLAAEVINKIFYLSQCDYKEILSEYKKRLMMLGKEISVVTPQGTYTATAIDIDDKGHLIVKTKGNETQVLSAGEISIKN